MKYFKLTMSIITLGWLPLLVLMCYLLIKYYLTIAEYIFIPSLILLFSGSLLYASNTLWTPRFEKYLNKLNELNEAIKKSNEDWDDTVLTREAIMCIATINMGMTKDSINNKKDQLSGKENISEGKIDCPYDLESKGEKGACECGGENQEECESFTKANT